MADDPETAGSAGIPEPGLRAEPGRALIRTRCGTSGGHESGCHKRGESCKERLFHRFLLRLAEGDSPDPATLQPGAYEPLTRH